jgi:hypothetical protein
VPLVLWHLIPQASALLWQWSFHVFNQIDYEALIEFGSTLIITKRGVAKVVVDP